MVATMDSLRTWVSKRTRKHEERKQPNKHWHKDTEKMIKVVENWYELVLNALARHKWDVSESWQTYFRGGIKLLEHSPCLWKDGNVFRITDARMEIHVVRLDFSPLDCRGAEPTRRSCRNPSVKPSQKSPGTVGLKPQRQHSHEEFLWSFDKQTT